jgi:hypothetical protein
MVSFLRNFAQVGWFVFSIKDAFDTFECVVGDVAIAYAVLFLHLQVSVLHWNFRIVPFHRVGGEPYVDSKIHEEVSS